MPYFNVVRKTRDGENSISIPIQALEYKKLTVNDLTIGNRNMPLYVPDLQDHIAPNLPPDLSNGKSINWIDNATKWIRAETTTMYVVVEDDAGTLNGYMVNWENDHIKRTSSSIPSRAEMLSDPHYYCYNTITICDLITQQTPLTIYPTANGFTITLPNHNNIYFSPELAKMFLGCSMKYNSQFYKLLQTKTMK